MHHRLFLQTLRAPTLEYPKEDEKGSAPLTFKDLLLALDGSAPLAHASDAASLTGLDQLVTHKRNQRILQIMLRKRIRVPPH